MLAIAVGKLKMRPCDFWQLTHREFVEVIKQWRELEEEKLQSQAYCIRLQTFYLVTAQGVKLNSPDKLAGFLPEEEKPVALKPPAEVRQAIIIEKYGITKVYNRKQHGR